MEPGSRDSPPPHLEAARSGGAARASSRTGVMVRIVFSLPIPLPARASRGDGDGPFVIPSFGPRASAGEYSGEAGTRARCRLRSWAQVSDGVFRFGVTLRVCAKINSDFAGGDWASWQGATSEHTRAVCERGATQPARPRPPARRGGAAPGHLLRGSVGRVSQGDTLPPLRLASGPAALPPKSEVIFAQTLSAGQLLSELSLDRRDAAEQAGPPLVLNVNGQCWIPLPDQGAERSDARRRAAAA